MEKEKELIGNKGEREGKKKEKARRGREKGKTERG